MAFLDYSKVIPSLADINEIPLKKTLSVNWTWS